VTRTVDPSEITTEVRDGIATVTLNRPRLNILDLALLRSMDAAVESLEARNEWRVLVLRGTSQAFSAGVAVEDHLPDRIEDTLRSFHALLRRVESFDRPTIAAVRGHCLGGGMELAMACDLVVAAETATFGQPEIGLAAIPPYAVARYGRLVGPRRAFLDLATGRTFPATEAMAAGYLTACVPEAALDGWVEKMTEVLAAHSRVAMAVLKRALREEREGDPFQAAERRYVRELARTPDAVEGLRAFLEKRPPQWGSAR